MTDSGAFPTDHSKHARVVLVTGGSRGIGLESARRLQAEGDRVAITFLTAPPAELKGGAGTHDLYPVQCDVTSPDAVEECFSAVEAALGKVEVLVCSAGITDDALLIRMTEERWSHVIDTDLSACYRVTRRAVANMIKAREGRIVLISSVVAMLGNAGQSNYCAAKAGLIGFARALARELAGRNITVNVVAPGLIDSDMTRSISDAQREQLTRSIPLGRLGTVREVGEAVAYLTGRDASYVTGSVLAIDGGLGMGY